MKLAYQEIETVFDLDNGQFNSLIIESQEMAVRLLETIHAQINGYEGDIVLSERNEPIPFSKRATFLDSFVPFDLNKKPLMQKIVSALERKASDAGHFEQTAEVLARVEAFLDSLVLDIPCELVYSNLSVGALIKTAAPELNADGASIAEKVLDYMDVVTEYDCERAFLLFNIRSFIPDDEMDLFAASILSHGYMVMDIETSSRKLLSNEFRVIIDEDMCEVV